MQQYLVSGRVCSAFGSPDNVVVVPPGYFGDLLATDWAEAVLGFPQIEQSSSAFQVRFHLYAQTVFKVGFPFRVIGIGVALHLDVPFDGCISCWVQMDCLLLPIRSLAHTREDPLAVSDRFKVFSFYPSSTFVPVSSLCPEP